MYEDKDFHNLVFVGRDASGKIRYATKHGTRDAYGQKYKGDVAGNDKNYGVNIVNKDSDVLKVFEASIDCMSYMDITGDYTSNKLDSGNLKREKVVGYLEKYTQQGYTVRDTCAPVVDGGGVKDYNEYLQYLKEVDPSAIAAIRKENQYHRKSR